MAAVLAVPWVAGCSSVQQTAGGWVDRARSVTEEGRVRYAATRHARVFREPDASSEVVHRLLLHEKVTAYQVENGFAYIRVAQTGQPGWVLEQDLIERIPRAAKPRAPEAAPAPQAGTAPEQATSAPEPDATAQPTAEPTTPEPTAESAAEAAEAAEPAPEEPAPDSGAPPPSPEKSVFDPY